MGYMYNKALKVKVCHWFLGVCTLYVSVVSLEQKLFSHDMLHILITCKLQRGVSCNPLKQKKMKSNHHSSINKIAMNVKDLKIEYWFEK